jgi:hypothetical protein
LGGIVILHSDEATIVLTSGGIKSITVTPDLEFPVPATENPNNFRRILENRDQFFQSLKEDYL